MSQNKDAANASTQTNVTTIQNAADTVWIADADAQIAKAIAMGSYSVSLWTNVKTNPMTLFQYYADLGYNVQFPDYVNEQGTGFPSPWSQPQNLFGYWWNQWWQTNNVSSMFRVKNPARITISWF